jgi:uncharacterized ferritin-like protein (DUF455 family)
MQKFLAYDHLAREDRFIRMRAWRVAEMRLEQGLPPFPDMRDVEALRDRLHGILVGELQAMEGAGRTVCDFADEAPWEFVMDMARQVWDESRHVDIYLQLLAHVGGYVGEYPENTILWRCACAETPEERVARVNHGLEGLACDVFAQLIRLARKIGDPVIERAVDYVLADEITPVRMGSNWLRKLTDDDPVRRQMALDFQHQLDELFNFGGGRREGPADQVSISISREVRQLAGFTDEEIDRLVKAASASAAY